MRATIEIRGAREHNLKNVSLEIPRDQLVVVTGVSGSGKSSLAFDTIYAEGQRRYMESLSSFVRHFVDHLSKPDVDFLYGLSPVISIEQKTAGRNPRSTVGTMTDVSNYLNLLFASSSQAHCPCCGAPVAVRTRSQLVEAVMALPAGTTVELRAPVFPVYGEDYEFLFTEIRKKGCRFLWLDGQKLDLSEPQTIDESVPHEMFAVTDRFAVKAGNEKQLGVAIAHALEIGERFVSIWIDPGSSSSSEPQGTASVSASSPSPGSSFLLTDLSRGGERYGVGEGQLNQEETRGASLANSAKKQRGKKSAAEAQPVDSMSSQGQPQEPNPSPPREGSVSLRTGREGQSGSRPSPYPLKGLGCAQHGLCAGDLSAAHFMFNEPTSACRTCLGLGSYRQVHVTLLIPDDKRSIREGALVPEAFKYNPDTYDGKIMWSLSQHYGFSVDTPWRELSDAAKQIVLQGTQGGEFELMQPADAKTENRHIGQKMRFEGLVNRIERHYRWARQQQQQHSHMENYLQKVMVDYRCPDCGGSRLRPQRLNFRLDGKNIHEAGGLNFADLRSWLSKAPLARNPSGGEPVRGEVVARLDLLLGIGLDYLNFNRASSTLSGGEAQRIRLSTQIGSGLMGMLYVLDEPSIGLHPKDNEKMIGTLRRLRDLGNTVIVVEHDEDTMRAADFLVEMGPGPGVHGGEVVALGVPPEVLANEKSLTAQFLSGRRKIEVPKERRPVSEKVIRVCGARENNLRNVEVEIPLGQFVCVTGASGSGKSTLVNDILFNRLYAHFYDSRTLSGEHDRIEGLEHLSDVVSIDQSPIGRSPRSNPATYIGVYDAIRDLFTSQPEAKARGYTSGRFSFNVKGGRCEECQGEGMVTTQLHFMPDVEVQCEVCKGARFNAETLEITFQGKNIAEVLDMPIEDSVEFFKGQPAIKRRLQVLHELGLGYLTLGQSATTLSGGEAQRVKLAFYLSKVRRGGHVLYILDEPTTGLHLADIEKLLECLNRLVDTGHTVLVIEHHLDVIKTADFVVDLGPEGGHAGGEIVATGTPEVIAAEPRSHTGRYLREVLGR